MHRYLETTRCTTLQKHLSRFAGSGGDKHNRQRRNWKRTISDMSSHGLEGPLYVFLRI